MATQWQRQADGSTYHWWQVLQNRKMDDGVLQTTPGGLAVETGDFLF
jgi:hypothetical protein